MKRLLITTFAALLLVGAVSCSPSKRIARICANNPEACNTEQRADTVVTVDTFVFVQRDMFTRVDTFYQVRKTTRDTTAELRKGETITVKAGGATTKVTRQSENVFRVEVESLDSLKHILTQQTIKINKLTKVNKVLEIEKKTIRTVFEKRSKFYRILTTFLAALLSIFVGKVAWSAAKKVWLR